MRLLITSVIATLCIISVATGRSTTAPGVTRQGNCYFYRGNNLEIKEACTITTGSGAGVQFVILKWSDGVETPIVREWMGNNSFRYRVGNSFAERYQDAHLNRNVECFQVRGTYNRVCYEFHSL